MTKNIAYMIATIIFLTFSICITVIPMGLAPKWNGDIPQHRDQYEMITNAFLKGQLSFLYEPNPELLKLDNPYDPSARSEAGVSFRWDHALYHDKYYMYFGVAPVITTFLPYHLIFGENLTTFHATQLYVGLYVIGIFLLFNLICKKFFSKVNYIIYLISAMVFALISSWVAISTPALYCTALSAALMFSIYAIYFYMKSVFDNNLSFNKKIMYATVASFCGALIFASRPNIGIILIVAIPLFITFIKTNKITKKDIYKIVIIFMPYLIIGGLLMYYNYLRFDSVFEFGQTYQLTSADQHYYNNILNNLSINRINEFIRYNFLIYNGVSNKFPFVSISGIFINFPILIIPYVLIFTKDFQKFLKKHYLLSLFIILLILPFLITLLQSVASPYSLVRYRLDFSFIMVISTFIAIFYMINNDQKINTYLISIMLLITLIMVILLFFVPFDENFTAYFPKIIQAINKFFFL
ncbi:MAG: hypothetical protein J5892_04630 [Bacilli bacterium]|nr:hypothetical protein [Bacilli bacterium]